MANQNLSQFTEKLFVADADHTFIWDAAGAISKRVSRNSWLSVGSIATSTPLTISQTWTDAAVAFAAMKIVATDTNSAVGSDFLELYSGTAIKPLRLDIQKTGQLNIYGTWTNSTTYERLSFSAPTAANAIIGTNKGIGGGTARGLEFQTDGVTRIKISSLGLVAFDIINAQNSYTFYNNNLAFGYWSPGGDTISGVKVGVGNTNFAASPLILDAGTGTGNGAAPVIVLRTGLSNTSGATVQTLEESIRIRSVAAGSSMITFNGVSSSSPAIKRSSTTLQARLADDSGFAPIQGKLTTDTAYTATTIVPTGFITLYDSNNTAYRVPCVVAP